MNFDLAALLTWAPAFALVLARIGATMTLLPGLGESEVPATVRIGITFCITVLVLPIVQPMMPPVPVSGVTMGLMVASEVVTGLWFGWVTRMIVLALPIAGEFLAVFLGISSVLQPDPELGAQSTAMSKLFEMAMPVLIVASGLYTLPLRGLVGLYQLIPPGQMLPSSDGVQVVMKDVSTAFALALKVASPFLVATVLWQFVMGQIARVVPRVQIHAIGIPGQIIGGLALLVSLIGAMIVAWRQGVEAFMGTMPGAG